MASAVSLAEVVLGAMILAIGGLALAYALVRRASAERMAIWFAAFVILYGIRMMVRVDLVHTALPVGHGALSAIDSVITYAIGLPAALFLLALLGESRTRILRLPVYAFGAYALIGIVSDAVTGRAYSAHWLNAPVVLFGVFAASYALIQLSRRGGVPSEARITLAAVGFFLGSATINTLTGGNTLTEGMGVLGIVLGLGYVTTTRIVRTERRMATIARDLELAGRIQRSILPAGVPRVAGLDVAARYEPVADVAGDLYDWTTLANGRLAILVADVSGHGVPAALVASMVKVAFASATDEAADPAEILRRINRTLHGKFESAFVTATCAVFDGRTGEVLYANAGHPPPIVRRTAGAPLESLDSAGPALTFLPDASYRTGTTTLDSGHLAVLFSDGLIEAENGNGEFFGDAELARTISGLDAGTADAALTALFGRLRAWLGPRAQLADDVTVVGVVRRGADPSGQKPARSSG